MSDSVFKLFVVFLIGLFLFLANEFGSGDWRDK